MATGLAIHRTHIEARPTPDAIEHLGKLAAQQLTTTVVHDHHMDLLGAVAITGAAGTGDDVGIARQRLTGTATGQQVEHQIGIFPTLHDALHAHHGHMDPGQRGAHTTIALVLHQKNGPSFGDGQIAAADTQIGVEKLLPQRFAGEGVEHFGVMANAPGIGAFIKDPLDVVAVQVHRRGNDVTGRVVVELDDPLPQICLHHLTAGRLEVGVEGCFFGGHGLALDNRTRAYGLGNAQDGVVGSARIGSPVHVNTHGQQVVGKAFQQLRQSFDSAGPHGPGGHP